jgi:hypothetical protein
LAVRLTVLLMFLLLVSSVRDGSGHFFAPCIAAPSDSRLYSLSSGWVDIDDIDDIEDIDDIGAVFVGGASTGTTDPCSVASYSLTCPNVSVTGALRRRQQQRQLTTSLHTMKTSRTAANRHSPAIDGAAAGQTWRTSALRE